MKDGKEGRIIECVSRTHAPEPGSPRVTVGSNCDRRMEEAAMIAFSAIMVNSGIILHRFNKAVVWSPRRLASLGYQLHLVPTSDLKTNTSGGSCLLSPLSRYSPFPPPPNTVCPFAFDAISFHDDGSLNAITSYRA